MRTGAAVGHEGYYHEAVPYASDDELLAVAVPFLLGGVEAGEPTLVALGERNAALLRAALPVNSGVSFLSNQETYHRPAVAIRTYREMLAEYLAGGAGQIRIIGELSPTVFGPTWDWWARYESAINHAYDIFPLWSMCAYNVRTTPAPVLEDVLRTHPRIATADGRHLPSVDYVEPKAYLTERRSVAPDPLQLSTPLVELTDPTPAEARHAVRDADRGQVPGDEVEDLVVAVSETVTNALRHGEPPTRLRIWSGDDRIVVEVSDTGDGPEDPYAGLLPARTDGAGGLGLWITYQACNHVALSRERESFTVRLTAGNPYGPGRPAG